MHCKHIWQICVLMCVVQFSPLTDNVVGWIWGAIQQRSSSSLFCRRPLWAVQVWAGMSTLWCRPSSIFSADHGVSHPPSALKDSFGEATVSCNMPEPCNFPSLDSCQKGFLWTHKKVDLLLHPVIGLGSKLEMWRRFLRHLVSKVWFLSFFVLFFAESANRVHFSHPLRRMEVTRDL